MELMNYYFKTFQVYSSLFFQCSYHHLLHISKLFKFIVHTVLAETPLTFNSISKLFKFIVHIKSVITCIPVSNISKLFKFIVHNSWYGKNCFISLISKLFKFIVHFFCFYFSSYLINFKTFQVYSSCIKKFLKWLWKMYFKTFQVYSS